MSSVVRLAPNISLNDEFADFDVREELERQLEERLTTADIDARPALRAFEPSADEDQLSLIHHEGEIIRLVAPAGSGKTQTIINRVLHLGKKGTRPERILCLTFDNSAAKRADDAKSSFVFVHSHPTGFLSHSSQDDREEAKLFKTAYVRIHTPQVHASLIFAKGTISAARVWHEDGSVTPVERIRIIGRRFTFLFPGASAETEPSPFFDRQVRAFGKDVQRVLKRLTIGLVGGGGTGSCSGEQLIRLGAGSISVDARFAAEGEHFSSVVTRSRRSKIGAKICPSKIRARLSH